MPCEKQTSVEHLSREELKELEANGQVNISACSSDLDSNNNTGNDNNNFKSNKMIPPPAKSRMSFKTKFFYAFGHVYNDMTVSIWFSYTLLFFEHRLGALAGTLLLLGQAADAVASPFIGFASDKFARRWPFNRYGRRKTWHIIGTFFSTISVPLTYNRCPLGDGQPEWVQFVYYGVLVVIFQTAWAATQVTHVALVNDLTPHQSERISLNSYRQAATMISNIVMFMISFFLLKMVAGSEQKSLQPEDLFVFTYLSYIVCAIGVVVTLFFYWFVEEPAVPPKHSTVISTVDNSAVGAKRHKNTGASPLPAVFTSVNLKNAEAFHCQKEAKLCTLTLARHLEDPDLTVSSIGSVGSTGSSTIGRNNFKAGSQETLSTSSRVQDTESLIRTHEKGWRQWFTSLSFWKLTIIYTAARMFINVSQVYVPLYLQHYLLLAKHTVAIIPLTTYLSSFFFSFVTIFTSKRWGSRFSMVIGAVIALVSCVWIWIGNDSDPYKEYQVYIVAGLLGMAGTFLLISSLSINNDLVGSNSKSNAFVFAAMSFFDKGFNGVLIEGLELFKPGHGSHSIDSNLSSTTIAANITTTITTTTISPNSTFPTSQSTLSQVSSTVASVARKHLVRTIEEPEEYYKLIMIILTGLPAIVILLMLLTILRTRYGKKAPKGAAPVMAAH